MKLAAVIVVFAFFYGWDVWEGLGNLVGLAPFYEAFGIGDQVPWPLLWIGVVAPVVVFGGALVTFRYLDSLMERTAVLLVGWATVGALSLSISALEQAWRAGALQAVIG